MTPKTYSERYSRHPLRSPRHGRDISTPKCEKCYFHPKREMGGKSPKSIKGKTLKNVILRKMAPESLISIVKNKAVSAGAAEVRFSQKHMEFSDFHNVS